MTNVNDSEINLGLALGFTNQCDDSLQNTSSSASAGAGANANTSSRVDTMKFVAPGPLTELVWSTQTGLTIKCAGCSTCFADNKPCMSSGPSQMGFPPSRDDKCAIEGHMVKPRATYHMGSNPFVGSSLGHNTDENVIEVKCARSEKEHLSSSKSIQIGKMAETIEGMQNRTTADLLPLLANESETFDQKTEIIHDGTDQLGLDIGFQSPLIEHVERGEHDLKEDDTSSGPFLEKIEEIAENDVQDLVSKDAIMEDLVPEEDSSTDSRMRGENQEESCQERDNGSHGSMQSCNSADLLSKRDKRWRFDQQLILGSKRIKKQTQECLFSTPVVKQDSSFVNWISNMVKGVKPNQEQDSLSLSVCDKSFSFGSKRLGFQSVFQSLYSPDAKPLQTRTLIRNKSVGSSKEIVLAGSDDCPNDQNASGSLWITRLSPKTPSKIKDSPFNVANLFEKPIVTQDNATHSNTPCIFCGKMGHGVRHCLEINEKELVGILGNVNLYEGAAKEATCLCIKCFQLDHWASVCPSKRRYNMINTKESQSDFDFKPKENETPNQLASTSSSGKNKLSLEAPKQMFDTIRKLRLSRTDILKWTNSCFPIVNLVGFFLRLRLAKWEEGVGGAGYYVACITGSGGENPSKGSKKPVRVNIGEVECLVESRYVSNCDFLEDELLAWWQKASKSGQIPIEEDLNFKLDERKKLGF